MATFQAEVAKSIRLECIPLILFATLDGVPAGTASIVYDDLPSRPDLNPWLASVFVDRPFRNRGVASRLVLTALSQADKLQVPQLYLFTHDRANFYERFGWVMFDAGEFMNRHVDLMIRRRDLSKKSG